MKPLIVCAFYFGGVMFKSDGAAAFFAAWKGLCLDTPVPHYREAFQHLPADIIPRLMIIEEMGDQQIVRFMGTARAEAWGEDLTGRNFLDIMTPSGAQVARRNLKTMCEHPCAMYHMAHYVTALGREVHMENITVPVGNDPGLPRRLLNFLEEISTITYSDSAGEVGRAGKRAWLDVGAGVPKKQPAK